MKSNIDGNYSAAAISGARPIPDLLVEEFKQIFGEFCGEEVTLFVYGSSMNPIHLAHAEIIDYFGFYINNDWAQENSGQHAKLIVTPTYFNPFKPDMASFAHRLKMANNILDLDANVFISDIEIEVFRDQLAKYPTLIDLLTTKHNLDILNNDEELTWFIANFKRILPDESRQHVGTKHVGWQNWREISSDLVMEASKYQTLNLLSYIQRIGEEIGVKFKFEYIVGLDNAIDIVMGNWDGIEQLRRLMNIQYCWRQIPGTKFSPNGKAQSYADDLIVAALSQWTKYGKTITYHPEIFSDPALENISSTAARGIVKEMHATGMPAAVWQHKFDELACMLGKENAEYILANDLYDNKKYLNNLCDDSVDLRDDCSELNSINKNDPNNDNNATKSRSSTPRP